MIFEAWCNEKQSAASTFIAWTANAWASSLSQLSPASAAFGDLVEKISFRADCDLDECKMFSSKFALVLSALSLGSQAQVYPRQSANTTAPLVNFQVAQPPITPKIGQSCTVELFRHTFANSYYQPEIVEYTVRLTDVNPCFGKEILFVCVL